MLRKCIIYFFIFTLNFLYVGIPAWALTADVGFNFDKNLEYDIFMNSGDNSTFVVQNVQILGFEELGEKKFLVIQSSAFKLQDTKGLILFDAVTAILPHRSFRVKDAPSSVAFP